MKKLFAIMSAVLALAACSKGELAEIEEQKQDNAASNPVTFNITVDDMGTKALKTDGPMAMSSISSSAASTISMFILPITVPAGM